MANNRKQALVIVGIASFYALGSWLMFTRPKLDDLFPIVSGAFLFSMPFAFGALVCFLGYKFGRPGRFWSLAAPPLLIAGLSVLAFLLGMEAAICLIVASPVLMVMAMLGGWIMSCILNRGGRDRVYVSLFVLLPYAVAPMEQLRQAPHETRVMRNEITIHATPQMVWSQIQSVPAIQPEELPSQWIYHIGFPRPIAATIDKQGVGGRRHATFERDVSFFEVVTHWEPAKKLSFTIKADPDFIPHTAFDEHIIVGGRFYDVLNGTYVIEPLNDGTCVLHLSSTHRLSTRFNWYAGWWSEWVMNQIQGSILEVIRQRCERGPTS
jgi:hypothetical protein